MLACTGPAACVTLAASFFAQSRLARWAGAPASDWTASWRLIGDVDREISPTPRARDRPTRQSRRARQNALSDPWRWAHTAMLIIAEIGDVSL